MCERVCVVSERRANGKRVYYFVVHGRGGIENAIRGRARSAARAVATTATTTTTAVATDRTVVRACERVSERAKGARARCVPKVVAAVAQW